MIEQLDPSSWNLRTSATLSHSFVAGEALAGLANRDPRIVVLTADLEYSNRTHEFAEAHPDRFLNFGIAEKNMITAAAGMATMGYIPYVATFASFAALLCAEQIRTDLAYPKVSVRVIGHHSGFTLGYYGTSHHATEDIGMMRSIAGLTIVAPCDALSLTAALHETVDEEGPIYFRLGRGRDPAVYNQRSIRHWKLGQPQRLRGGEDLTILAYGTTVAPALQAATTAQERGLSVGVLDVHTLKPLDTNAVYQVAKDARLGVLVAEEHNTIGGLATAVADCLSEAGCATPLHRLGVPDQYVPVAPPTSLTRLYGLDANGILSKILSIADIASRPPARSNRSDK